jgi:2-haloacid dehalogenase
MEEIEAFVFDAYGTIFDVRSVFATCEAVFPGHGDEITRLWRVKQLEYSWLRTLMKRYEDFWQLTQDGLRYTCQFLGLKASEGQLDQMLQAYLNLEVYADLPAALRKLQQTGVKRAILSNGSPQMLNTVVDNNGLTSLFDAVLSVDEVRHYKPDPAVYALAPQKLGVAKEKIGFVSSNGWDVAGAKSFGFKTFWINRTNVPVEELSAPPDRIISSAEMIF